MEDGFLTIYYDVPADSNDCTTGKVLKSWGFPNSITTKNILQQVNQNVILNLRIEKVVTIRTDISYLTVIHQSLMVTIQIFVFVSGYGKHIKDNSKEEELIAFRDTKIKGTIDTTGVFINFETPINLFAPDSSVIDTTIAKKVDVSANFWKKNKNLVKISVFVIVG